MSAKIKKLIQLYYRCRDIHVSTEILFVFVLYLFDYFKILNH